MEQTDRDLIEKIAENDPEIRELWEDHMLYSKQVTKLESKPFRTPTEEQTLKQLKKQKLEGKTSLVDLLDKYKQEN